MAFSIKGIHVPHRKNTANKPVAVMEAPKVITIPTVMHIGAPAKPVVKVGDHVDVGTLVAEQNGFVSSPVYSGVSGKVTKIADMLLSTGKYAPAITIESDGEMTVSDTVAPPVINSREDVIEAIKQSGIVGLGGAGFPTYVKFKTDKPIEALIINGAECEPYITSDSYTMTNRAEDMFCAIECLVKYFDIGKVVIGIEKNKPEAIKKMSELSARDSRISVKVLPGVYPQGGEKVLVYNTVGKVIEIGKLPIDVGCVVCNCTTVAEIGAYLKTGMPLVKKCITVDGDVVKEPKNVIAPIGTPIIDLLNFCGGLTQEPQKVLYGGPMMGISVPSLDLPVLKQTNAIVAMSPRISDPPKTTACIKCGTCINNCPFGINATAVARAYLNNDIDALEKLGASSCMECGCCSYNCPANRPLVQTNKLAKAALAQSKAKKEGK